MSRVVRARGPPDTLMPAQVGAGISGVPEQTAL